MPDFLHEAVFEAAGQASLACDTDFIRNLVLNFLDNGSIACSFEGRSDRPVSARDVLRPRQVGDVAAYMEQHGVTEPSAR